MPSSLQQWDLSAIVSADAGKRRQGVSLRIAGALGIPDEDAAGIYSLWRYAKDERIEHEKSGTDVVDECIVFLNSRIALTPNDLQKTRLGRTLHLLQQIRRSILDGACRIPALAKKAAELEMPAVSLTDHGSMAGAIDLYKAAREQGIKPIFGCEVYVVDDRRAQTKGHAHLTLLARDNAGYGNLIKLCSLGYLEGYYYKPRVDWELLERHAPGLIALSGCLSGRVSRALSEHARSDAEAELDRLAQIFGRDSTYVELQNVGLEVQQASFRGLPALAGGAGAAARRDRRRPLPRRVRRRRATRRSSASSPATR